MEGSVLVLNQNYDPLNVCHVRRALVLVDHGKAETLEHNGKVARSPSRIVPLPSVIRLVYQVRRPRPQARLTRRDVFQRDGFRCLYCGITTHDLTLDHVVPRHKGGTHDWENLASACRACNHRKANRTPAEARMALLRLPVQPRYGAYHRFFRYLDGNDEWAKFIPGAEEQRETAS